MTETKKKDEHYAWSPIKVGDADGKVKMIQPGRKVKPEHLEHGEEGETGSFDEFVASGAVRPYPYPDMPASANLMSPLDYMRNLAIAKADSEEERLMAISGEEITQASRGPVGETAPPLPEGVEPTSTK